AVAFASRDFWLPWINENQTSTSSESAAPAEAAPTGKIIVSDQAQQNLRLTARPLTATTFWKTIAVQGMIVDRPGVSDREIVAPTTGIVTAINHVFGDIVRPGEGLFTLKLTSEEFNKTQTDLYKTSGEITLAEDRLERLSGGGSGIAQSRVIEAKSEVTRLEAAAKAYAFELRNQGLSGEDIRRVQEGELLSEISIAAPSLSVMR